MKIFEKTKIRPSIDRIYTLDEINEENANVTTVDTSITEVPENTEPVESQNAVEPEEVVE